MRQAAEQKSTAQGVSKCRHPIRILFRSARRLPSRGLSLRPPVPGHPGTGTSVRLQRLTGRFPSLSPTSRSTGMDERIVVQKDDVVGRSVIHSDVVTLAEESIFSDFDKRKATLEGCFLRMATSSSVDPFSTTMISRMSSLFASMQRFEALNCRIGLVVIENDDGDVSVKERIRSAWPHRILSRVGGRSLGAWSNQTRQQANRSRHSPGGRTQNSAMRREPRRPHRRGPRPGVDVP